MTGDHQFCNYLAIPGTVCNKCGQYVPTQDPAADPRLVREFREADAARTPTPDEMLEVAKSIPDTSDGVTYGLAGFVRILCRDLAASQERVKELERSKEYTQEWYAARIKWLEVWFRNEGKDLPIAKQFWNIIANGTPDVMTPPTYQQQLNMAKHRAEKAEQERDALAKALRRIIDTAMFWPQAGVTCGEIAVRALAQSSQPVSSEMDSPNK